MGKETNLRGGGAPSKTRGTQVCLRSKGMWPGSIIRENTRKSHFPADMSGKLSEVCQEFDLASSIITLKTYYYPINKRPLQMERAKEEISSCLCVDSSN